VKHPFAAAGPVETDVDDAAAVIREHGGIVFWGPEARGADGRTMAIGVTRDRLAVVPPLNAILRTA
jgi:hypothetical protein